ncbi:MAG: sigma 54-interacting transcriptional regulator [Vicinamibacterales bacterium]
MARLLVIDGSTTALGETFARPPLADEPWIVERTHWHTFAVETYRVSPADVIVAAAAPAESKLFDLFAWLRSDPRGSVTIVALPPDADRTFLQQCLSAADDFVLYPVRPTELRHRITRILGQGREAGATVRARLNFAHGLANLVGADAAFVRQVAHIPLAARTNCEVLVTGETGTGKELCARAIHHLSRRSGLPFVCADCAALPDHLFENEMFGHERGAFTDAHRSQKGLVAVAEGGTLFLDEIDALSLHAQAKLLRLAQDHTYKALGGERFVKADVRIVTATNKDLDQAVEAGTFRRDLFFRINVLRIHMMPLRDRRGDIPALAEHFLEVCCAEMGCRPKRLASSSVQLLTSLDWPGNVRELYNFIRRTVVFCEGPQILPAHLMPDRDLAPAASVPGSFRNARALALNAFERRYVEEILRRHHGNVTRAAEEAGKDRRVFGRMIKRLNVDRTAMGLPSPRPGVGRTGPTRTS